MATVHFRLAATGPCRAAKNRIQTPNLRGAKLPQKSRGEKKKTDKTVKPVYTRLFFGVKEMLLHS